MKKNQKQNWGDYFWSQFKKEYGIDARKKDESALEYLSKVAQLVEMHRKE